MEDRDLELIRKYQESDEKLNKLFRQHIDFERELERLNGKPYLSPNEEVERKTIQKKKLLGRDMIELILRKYRKMENMS